MLKAWFRSRCIDTYGIQKVYYVEMVRQRTIMTNECHIQIWIFDTCTKGVFGSIFISHVLHFFSFYIYIYNLNFALVYDLLIANTVFKKRESHLVTFRSGQHSSQIDLILSRREDRRDCLNCKVMPGECVVPQHKLVVADFFWSGTSD